MKAEFNTRCTCIYCRKNLIDRINDCPRCGTDSAHGMGYEDLEERNRNYLELIKYLIACHSHTYKHRCSSFKEIIGYIERNGYDLEVANQSLNEIAERLTEDKE